MLYTKNNLANNLYFDIEVISKTKSLNDLTPEAKRIWMFRYHTKFKDKAIEEKRKYDAAGMTWYIDIEDPNEIYLKYAPLVAEYAKVIAICFGKVDIKNGKAEKSNDFEVITDDNEVELLKKTIIVFDALKHLTPAGFNISGYDIPMLCKRMALNNLRIPNMINFLGKKPWEVNISDLSNDWKLGGYDMIAFESLTESLDLGNSKGGAVNGMELGWLYYNKKCTLKDIEEYVKEDVSKNIDAFIKLSY